MAIISLGGSLIVPDAIDTAFLRDFAALVRRLLDEGERLVIITGGGKTCRQYQAAAREAGRVSDEDLDWLGIHSTRLNAHLVRTIFADVADPVIVTNPVEDELPEAPLIIGAGWRPGCSTDHDAALLAGRLGATRLVNLSNVAHVYSEDPRENPDATRFERMTWDELLAITGTEWSPGRNVPFDPVAAQQCKEQSIEAAILSADDMANVEAALRGDEFRGTRIVP